MNGLSLMFHQNTEYYLGRLKQRSLIHQQHEFEQHINLRHH